jgi:hypothetical protein
MKEILTMKSSISNTMKNFTLYLYDVIEDVHYASLALVPRLFLEQRSTQLYAHVAWNNKVV